MRLDQFIWIDRFIGTPVCWILSQFYAIEKRFKKDKKCEIRKLLLIKPSEMGTSVILYPVIQKAKDIFPGVKIYFLVFKENDEILKTLNIIDAQNILTIRTGSFFSFIKDTLGALIRLRKEKIDAAIDFEFFSRYTNVVSFLSGASQRAGFYRYYMEGLYRGDLMTHQIHFNDKVHVGISFMTLLLALTRSPEEMPFKEPIPMSYLNLPRLGITPEAKASIWNKLKALNADINDSKDIVVINPNTSQLIPFRKWPVENYIELSKRVLANYPNAYVVIIGLPMDREYIETIHLKINNDRCLNFIGQVNIKELIDLFQIARVLVSVDSGPAHFAALTPVYVVSIFGPETPVIFSPLTKNSICLTSGLACHPCMSVFNSRRPVCSDVVKECLKAVTVDRVYESVMKII